MSQFPTVGDWINEQIKNGNIPKQSLKCYNEVFPLRTKVILHGLKSGKYNGKNGIITSCLNVKCTKRFGVLIDGQNKSILIKPSNLMTQEGVPPVFVFEIAGIKVPLKAMLHVNQYYDEIAVSLKYSDHLGLKALEPAAKKFFGCDSTDDSFPEIVGETFCILSTALEAYRTKPKEIAIAMYKHKEISRWMHNNALIKLTERTVEQGYGTFTIAKICFQQMFYHDVLPAMDQRN